MPNIDPNTLLTHTVSLEEATRKKYDVVIVGCGISASILAKELAAAKFQILIVEAGLGGDIPQDGYQRYLETFYAAVSKDNNSPYPPNPNAEMPRGPDIKRYRPGLPNTDAYWVQYGPYVSDSVYTRVLGGTTMHWEGKTIRMLEEDFKMRSRYGRGLDWPITLKDLMPYYRMAEHEIGVSGDAEAQKKIGVKFDDHYVYPMMEMPPSYLDQEVAKDLAGMKVSLDGDDYELWLTTFPQARNGVPNESYKAWNGGKTLQPGRSRQPSSSRGRRALPGKYQLRSTLPGAGRNTTLAKPSPRRWAPAGSTCFRGAVASHVDFDPATGEVRQIQVKVYESRESSAIEPPPCAANGLSSPPTRSRTPPDACLVAGERERPECQRPDRKEFNGSSFPSDRGLLPKNLGVGPRAAGDLRICNFRRGPFRRRQACFAIDLHNDGWGWATGSPVSDLVDTVDNLNKYGAELRRELLRRISRQLLLAFMVEMLPEQPTGSRSIPVLPTPSATCARSSRIKFPITAWLGSSTRANCPGSCSSDSARKTTPLTTRSTTATSLTMGRAMPCGEVIIWPAPISWERDGGTRSSIPTRSRGTHPNLYLIGAGSMPTIGSSNTTLTLAALCFKTADAIVKEKADHPIATSK